MKRTTLLVGALAIAVIATATPAFAMRDPGPGGMRGAMPPRVGQAGLGGQYADGMNLYQYARSTPPNGTDPMGKLFWLSGCSSSKPTPPPDTCHLAYGRPPREGYGVHVSYKGEGTWADWYSYEVGTFYWVDGDQYVRTPDRRFIPIGDASNWTSGRRHRTAWKSNWDTFAAGYQARSFTAQDVGSYMAYAGGEGNFFRNLVQYRAGNAHAVRSGRDILARLETTTRGWNCIRKWVHAQHAWTDGSAWARARSGGLGGGLAGNDTGLYGQLGTEGGQGAGRRAGGRDLSDLASLLEVGRIRFCRPCEIYLYGCQVAEFRHFPTQLSIMTGCTVYAADGKNSTTHADGTRGTHEDPWRAGQGWYTFSGGQCTPMNQTYLSPPRPPSE
jgi:hypothetical protein